MSHPTLEDPDFRTAVGVAKALAKQYEPKELSPLLSLCAFAVAWRNEQLKTALRQSGVTDSYLGQPAAAAGMTPSSALHHPTAPTDAALRFTAALLNTIPDWAIDAIFREGGVSEIAQIGSAVVRADGLKEISPQLLVAGALVAYHQGALLKRPSICQNLRIDDVGIKALIGDLATKGKPKLGAESPPGLSVASATKNRRLQRGA